MPARILDTHVHVWDISTVTYDWLKNDATFLNRTYNLQELNPEVGKTNVVQGVLIQAANNFEDTDLMLETAARNKWISGVVGWLPLQDPQSTARALKQKYEGNRFLKGVRHLMHNEKSAQWLLQNDIIKSLKMVAAQGLTYDVVGVNVEHLQSAISLAKRIPSLNIVLDHLNQPPFSSQLKFEEWKAQMEKAAEFRNIYAKISGLGTAVGKGTEWTSIDVAPAINVAVSSFGVERCFCGGDWPVSLLAGSYPKIWLAYQDVLKDLLTNDEQDKVLYRNACKFYNL